MQHSSPVTVVSGLPRSGTSMMMQMLAAGGMPVLTDGIREADEDNPRGYLEFGPVIRTRNDPGWVSLAAGKAVKVVHLLLEYLPLEFDYRVIFMHRDLREVLASQRAMLDRLGRPGARLDESRLLAVYAAQVRNASDWLRNQPRFRALEVDYKSCLEDPVAVAGRVADFLDCRLDARAMAASVAPTLSRHHRAPVSSSHEESLRP